MFGDPGLIILDFVFYKCVICNSSVHTRLFPCSQDCLDTLKITRNDYMSYIIPRVYLPCKDMKYMYTRKRMRAYIKNKYSRNNKKICE